MAEHELCSRPTADLGAGLLREVRALLDTAFAGGFTEQDWDHALGGVHVLLRDGGVLAGHAAVVARRVLHGGRALRTGYVEAVAVHRGYRRRGYGGVLMDEVGRLVRGGYQLGALAATEMAAPLYRGRGWRCWSGRCRSLTPDGVVDTPDAEGTVYLLPVSVKLDPADPLTCDWRDGDVW
jgi:aminoglycoside 2'-N-acetyltransferase I